MGQEDRDWYRDKSIDLDKGGFMKRSAWSELFEMVQSRESKWYEIYRLRFWREYWAITTVRWWMLPIHILLVVAFVAAVRKTGITQFMAERVAILIIGY